MPIHLFRPDQNFSEPDRSVPYCYGTDTVVIIAEGSVIVEGFEFSEDYRTDDGSLWLELKNRLLKNFNLCRNIFGFGAHELLKPKNK